MKNVTTIGIDLAKNVFQIHGADKRGNKVFTKRLSRAKFPVFMANQKPCLVGMEACGGSHHFARVLSQFGHDVKLMSPQYVKPYVKTNKNDANDAQACAEAVTRPSMRFVTVKSIEQQEIQSMHRIRSHYVKRRTGLMNMVRGILTEYGIVFAKGEAALKKGLQGLLEPEQDTLPPTLKATIPSLYNDLKQLDKQIDDYTKQMKKLGQQNEDARLLQSIDGIGPINATALLAKIGAGTEFKNGREVAANFGLVPRQNSSGQKQRLSGISKRGDRYVRTLLIHGARACVSAALAKEKTDAHSLWIRNLVLRVGKNRAAVAVANKNARIAWSMLQSKEKFNPNMAH